MLMVQNGVRILKFNVRKKSYRLCGKPARVNNRDQYSALQRIIEPLRYYVPKFP